MKKPPYEITSEQVGEWLDKQAGTRTSRPDDLQSRNAYALGMAQSIIASLLSGDDSALAYYRRRLKE